MTKILWIKFGWSDLYRGGSVDGNFGWLIDNKEKEDEGRGHEAYNFDPGPDGTYYCYVPPQRKIYAPYNTSKDGWTVICLAKNPKYKGIHIVGWYENATLYGDWIDPPANLTKKRRNSYGAAHKCSYCITSKTAYFVLPQYRVVPFSDTSVRQGKYSFLRGPNVSVTDNKNRVLKILLQRMKALAPRAVKNPSESSLPDPEIDSADPLKGYFGTPEQRKAVEKAAERAVIKHYEHKGFTSKRVTNLPCGYDFVFTKGRTVLHVEVKGTGNQVPQFFLTRNEHLKGLHANPAWRLAMVTSALSESPNIAIYDAKLLARSFNIEPYVFFGKFISVPTD